MSDENLAVPVGPLFDLATPTEHEMRQIFGPKKKPARLDALMQIERWRAGRKLKVALRKQRAAQKTLAKVEPDLGRRTKVGKCHHTTIVHLRMQRTRANQELAAARGEIAMWKEYLD